jgi:6-pyruvoyltetrahydropterin/6-carboxytetrahydropterin synthase
MYTVAVRNNFVARHCLIGEQGVPENNLHSHHYVVEVRLEGRRLDERGYLFDLCEVETTLTTLLERYRDKNLNELSEFEGLNPSLEHFARILGSALAKDIEIGSLSALTIRIWESDSAWASYQTVFSCA